MITPIQFLDKFVDQKVKYLVRPNGGTAGSIAGNEQEGTLVGYDDKGILVTFDYKIEGLPVRYYLIPWDTEFSISAPGIGELISG